MKLYSYLALISSAYAVSISKMEAPNTIDLIGTEASESTEANEEGCKNVTFYEVIKVRAGKSAEGKGSWGYKLPGMISMVA